MKFILFFAFLAIALAGLTEQEIKVAGILATIKTREHSHCARYEAANTRKEDERVIASGKEHYSQEQVTCKNTPKHLSKNRYGRLKLC